MVFEKIPPLRIGNLEARIPIIQGGMGVGISLSGLASAVANAGGIGVIATAGIGQFEPDVGTNFKEANKRALRKQIARTRANTNGLIGLNIMVALSDFDDLVQCGVDEQVDVLLLGAGLPIKLPHTLPLDALGTLHTKFAPIVSSDRAAELIFKSWAKHFNHVPDAVVVEGPMAGGHLGFKKEQIADPDYALEKILPPVISAIKPYEQRFQKNIPVIPAGGIYTGADIYKFMQLGAGGVQMATRFVATFECDASDEYKQAFLNCTKDDIIIIDSPVGLPGRAIRCEFLDRIASGAKEPFQCPWKCLRSCDFKDVPYCIALALTKAKNGDLKHGFAFAGANVYRVNKLVSVKELIDELMDEFQRCASGKPARSAASSEQRLPSNVVGEAKSKGRGAKFTLS
jgi:NAD(P)H-dependent flavin oxidoreductase YrpB (nitropropane dioxygenase family)